jgi:hypothetical protein
MAAGTDLLLGGDTLPAPNPDNLDDILTPEQASALLHTSPAALACSRHRAKDGGFAIPWVRLGGRVFYTRRDILAAVRANRRTSTKGEG